MDCRGARVDATRPVRDDCPPGTGTMDGGLDCSGSSEEGDKRTDVGSVCSLFKITHGTCLVYRRSLTNGTCYVAVLFLSKKLEEINELVLAHRTSKFSQCTALTVAGSSSTKHQTPYLSSFSFQSFLHLAAILTILEHSFIMFILLISTLYLFMQLLSNCSELGLHGGWGSHTLDRGFASGMSEFTWGDMVNTNEIIERSKREWHN